MPYGNPTIPWTDVSYTLFGPANHLATVRTMYCPAAIHQPLASTNSWTLSWAGYDRSSTLNVSGSFCAYDALATSAICDTDASGVGFTGSFNRLFPYGIGNIPTGNSHFVLTVTLPGVSGGQVSHITHYAAAQLT